MREIFLKILTIMIVIAKSNSNIELREDALESDIEDIILILAPGLVLNLETPADTFIGDISVLTFSKNNYRALMIDEDNEFVYLVDEKLYLKDSGNIILQNVNHITFEVTAIDANEPPGLFSKYLRIPVDHKKEDSVFKVESIDDLCNTDSNRFLFSLDIDDPNYDPLKPYDCRLTRTNYPNVDFLEYKMNNTHYEIFLPAFDSPMQTSFFDLEKSPVLLIEISCTNNMVITHQRTVDFKICKKILPIENLILDGGISDSDVWIQFDSQPGTSVAQLKVVDYSNRYLDNYEFYLAEANEYLDVSRNGMIRIRRKLETPLLKYYFPKLKITAAVADLMEAGRDIQRMFRFNINDTNQPLPPLRFRPDFQLIPIFQFAQQAEFLIKLGQFELNSTTYPPDRFDIRLAAGNVTLDDQGNLYIGQDPLNDIDTENKTAIVALNIYDKKANVSVFEDIFEIDIPELPTTAVSAPTTNFPITTPNKIPDILECVSDRDCNSQRVGPNKCIRLSSLREQTMNRSNDVETTLRVMQFLINKDASIFLKYNEILLVLQSQDKELQDVLDKYQITQKDLADVGACLCDQDTQGWRCETPLPNPTPYKCHPNSTVPACIPQNGVCRPSEFLLRNTIKIPSERLLEYRSYYCECTATGIVGVNCDYRRNPCNVPRQQQRRFRRQYDGELEPIVAKQSAPFISDSVSQYPTSGLGSLDANQGQCNADPTKEFCQPQVSISQLSSYKCVKQPQAEVTNYLVFDESNRNPHFANNVDAYKKLNLSDATVAVGIQSFIRDEVMPRYSFNDYSKIPKGPLAIMRPSVNMPNILNSVRNKVNGLIDRRAEEVLDQLQYARVQDLVQDTLLYLIATNKINISLTGDNLTQTILQTVNKLNVNNLKNFSTPLWNLIPDQFPANLTNPNDPTGLIRHLNALQSNSDRLNSPDSLGNVLGLNADNQRYIDFFNFSTRPYSLLKLDILPGIFIDSDNELSLRPVPGVFLESIPTDPASPDRELIFLPGIFNPVATANCDLRSLFMPGIMSLPIDNYDLANLPFDNSRYLNRFVPMQIPFNINGFITPMRASASDTIASLLMQQQNTTFNSHLLLTPIDFNAEATFDIIAKNDKFITNLFSNRSFNQVVEQQKPLDAQNLASTLVLSDPTMIGLNKQDSLNSACLNRTGFLPPYDARGTQFYNTSTPVTNVTVLPFVVYDDAGNPIPKAVVKAAIDKYCETYMAQMNDFHARICAAQAQTNKILEEQVKGLCPGCPFSQLAYEYYNPRNVKKRNTIPILVLASILAALWLLWMLSMLLCCCFRWCPLYSLFCGKKRPKKPQLVMTNKSAKVFNKGINNNQVSPVDSIYTMIANGELVRSSPKDQARSFYTFSNAVPEPSRPLAYALSGPGKIITPSGGLLPAPPVISRHSLIPQFKHDKSELIINEPFAPSVQTNRSVLIKPSTNLSTVFSSSLVKPISLPAASPGMFVAKRLLPPTNLKRSFSLINVTEFEQPVNFFKRSSSYPFIDIPNFYINNRFVDESWPRHVIHRFNKTTFIDENGKPSWKFFEVKDDWRPPSSATTAVLKSPSVPLDFDDSISQITPNQRKNIEFKLKRLSNYIVDNPALESAPRVGSPTNPNFPLSRQDMERPPNYKSLSGPLIDQNDSNELVIDWLLRKTNNNGNDNESDVTSPSNLTVVRLENNRVPSSPPPPPPLSPPSALKRFASQRCFVCNQKVNDANANSDSNTNQDEAIYICDGCYESWYSAPAGTTTTKTPAASSSPRQRENESPTSTIYALTKDNRLQPNNRGKKNSSNF